MEQGNCKIYNKTSGEYLKKIEVRVYSFQLAPLIGEGGREFLADGDVFYSVVDWES